MFMRGDETCPHCYQVLIELAKFDPRADALGLDDGGWGLNQFARKNVGGVSSLLSLVDMAMDWLGGRTKYRRLQRVLREYPNSMSCSGCGYIDRHR